MIAPRAGSLRRPSRRRAPARDRAIVAALEAWFAREARDLPWRRVDPATGRRDPYRALVSEVMLQQTQVGRVVERFDAFLGRFPTPRALAGAGDAAVLRAWAGMGYYERALRLRDAARALEERWGGRMPTTAAELRELPGVGRYTAGAIASIVFGRAEACVDGNVARVLARVEREPIRTGEAAGLAWAWERAGALAGEAGDRAGVVNEALMELGATVCTPRSPACGSCPLSQVCRSRATGAWSAIPAARVARARTTVRCASVVVRDGRGRVLVRQRATGGTWAGLWEVPTLEGARRASESRVAAWAGVAGLARAGSFVHETTQRRYEFEVWQGRPAEGRAGQAGRWCGRRALAALAMSSAQRRVLALSAE